MIGLRDIFEEASRSEDIETGDTLLLTLIKLNESPNVIRELLKCGTSIEARNKHTMNTPLIEATQARECPPETIQTLLEYGAAVKAANKYCETPLHYACKNFRNDLRIIQLLLKFGSPVNFRNFKGETPLNVALKNRNCTAGLVRILLKFGAKVDFRTFQDALLHLRDDYYDILSELVLRSPIRSVYDWSLILKYMFRHVTKEEKLIGCGKLIIKHMFLECEDPHTQIVSSLNRFKEVHPIFGSVRVRRIRGHVPVAFLKLEHHLPDLASTCCSLISFANDCLSEIELMKTDMLQNGISLYQFIASKTAKAHLDTKILKVLKENTYPVFSDNILSKIKRAALIDKLALQQVYTIVQHGDAARTVMLDSLSVCKIASYLNVDEVKSFIEAFCNPTEDSYCFWDNLMEICMKPQKCPLGIKRKLVQSSSKVLKKTSPRI